MQNKKNYNRSKPEILRLLWDIVVFLWVIVVTNLLNVICLIQNTKLHTYEFSNNFATVLYQFLETGTSDRCFICIV